MAVRGALGDPASSIQSDDAETSKHACLIRLTSSWEAPEVADLPGIELTGFIAWLTWLFVHLFYLIGVQNRVVVFTRWSAGFLTDGRSSRIITTGGAIQPPSRPRPRSGRA